MKTNRRFIAAALSGLLIASCAHRPDTRIADLTREYVAGRISYRRYAERCYAIYLESPSHTSGGTTSSDSSSSDSSNTERDNRHEKETRDKAHADTYHPAPPPAPAGVVSPQPPPPPDSR